MYHHYWSCNINITINKQCLKLWMSQKWPKAILSLQYHLIKKNYLQVSKSFCNVLSENFTSKCKRSNLMLWQDMSNHDNKDNNKIAHSVDKKNCSNSLCIVVGQNWLNNKKSIIMRMHFLRQWFLNCLSKFLEIFSEGKTNFD